METAATIADMKAVMSKKDSELRVLKTGMSEKAVALARLEAVVSEKDAKLAELEVVMSEKNARLVDLEACDSRLKMTVSENDIKLTELETAASEKDARVAELETVASKKDTKLAGWEARLVEKDGKLARFEAAMVERDAKVLNLQARMSELKALEEIKVELSQALQKKNAELESNVMEMADLEATIAKRDATVKLLHEGNHALSSTHASLEATIERLGAENEANAVKTLSLWKQIESKEFRVQEVEAAACGKDAKIQELVAEVASFASNVTRLEDNLKLKLDELKIAHQRAATLEENNFDLAKIQRNLRRQGDLDSSSMKAATSDKDAKLKLLEDAALNRANEVAQLQNKLKCTSQDSESAFKDSKIPNAGQSLECVRGKLDCKISELAECRQQHVVAMNQLRGNLDTSNARHAELQAIGTQKDSVLDKMKMMMANKDALVITLEEDAMRAVGNTRYLEKELVLVLEELKKVRIKLAAVKEDRILSSELNHVSSVDTDLPNSVELDEIL
jgi:chromosome segregation ATPase